MAKLSEFAEYLLFNQNNYPIEKSYAQYLQTGGFPEAIKLSQTGIVYSNQYVQSVFQNIYQIS